MGVQVFGGDVIPQVLGQMAYGGAKWVRVIILWSVLEPTNTTPPTYNWSYSDALITPLVAGGFTPVGVIYSNPSWAANTSCGPVDRVPLSRFEQFIGALVERYDGDGVDDAPRSPRVLHWEISNEEDFSPSHAGGQGDHGGCFGDNPPAYGTHLRAAYLGAKSASSDAQIIFGGVAYDRFHNLPGYSPPGPFDYAFVGQTLSWLDALFGSGPDFPFFDIMAVHIYNDYRDNWDGTAPPFDQELVAKIAHFREHQLYATGRYDLRDVPLMLTEASLPSMPSDTWTERSEDIQAAYPGQLMARSMAVGAQNAVWFTIEDSFTGACDNPWAWLTFGLLRSQDVYQAAQACDPNPLPGYNVAAPHEPKPSLAAYRTAVGLLGGVPYDRQLDAGETGSPEIQAFRFQTTGGRYLIVAFTDNGRPLGRRGYPPVERDMTFDNGVLPDWTGQLRVTDHLGNETLFSGDSVTLTIRQAAVYVRADP